MKNSGVEISNFDLSASLAYHKTLTKAWSSPLANENVARRRQAARERSEPDSKGGAFGSFLSSFLVE